MKTYPRYFIGRLWSERDAYLRFDSQCRSVWVRNDGTECKWETWLADEPHETWREVSEVEAKARITKPQPQQPLRWVENCKPDKPGIWAWQYTEWNSITNVSGIICESDLVHAASKGVRYCYLGPIPEILPPKKKVVERLWISHAKQTAQDAAEYLEQWVPEDKREGLAGDWIRTDRTREVEQ